ncbi:MAG: CesT family type III secretion system chaperone [Janthinobacterium lividum]
MTAWDTVNGWLARINPGDAGMHLNDVGLCELFADGNPGCLISVAKPDATEFHLLRDIRKLPATTSTLAFQDILQLNLPRQATRAGALAYDAGSGNLLFRYTREIAVTDFTLFCSVLENFMQAAQTLGERLDVILAPAARLRQHDSGRHALLSQLSPPPLFKT